MQLWFAPASPFVRKVMVLAHETGLADQIELLDAAAHPINRDARIIDTNPLGKIPTMVLDDGHVLFDSRVIMEYLDGLHDGEKMVAAEGPDRFNALVTQSIADGIMDAAVLMRYEVAVRPEDKQWQGWLDGQREKIRSAIHHLEYWRAARLERIHVGSIATVCALSYLDFRQPDFDWREGHPMLTQMHATFSKRQSMLLTQPE